MAIYRTSKCPHCGFILENAVTTSKEEIGPPVAECPSCKGSIETGMKYWKDFSRGEKVEFWITQIPVLLYTAFFFSFIPTLVIFGITTEIFHYDVSGEMILIILGISCMVVIFLMCKKYKNLMSLTDGNKNQYSWDQ